MKYYLKTFLSEFVQTFKNIGFIVYSGYILAAILFIGNTILLDKNSPIFFIQFSNIIFWGVIIIASGVFLAIVIHAFITAKIISNKNSSLK